MIRIPAVFFVSVLTFSVGCVTDEGLLGSTQQYEKTYNGKTYNGKTYNGLLYEGQDLQDSAEAALTTGVRAPGEWDYNEVTTFQDDADGRATIEYLVKCALPASETVVVFDASLNRYDYSGELDLAPDWKTRALTSTEQEWVSSCMLAHVNNSGASVQISVRAAGSNPSSPVIGAGSQEQSDYPVHEGAFYGQIFSNDVANKSFACQGDDQDLAILLSDDREVRRLCADDTTANGSECDVIVTGRCRDVCSSYNPALGWQDCKDSAGSVTYAQTVNVYLPADNTNVETAECGSGNNCTGASELDHTSSASAALLDCSDANNCEATCDGKDCLMDGEDATNFDAVVTNGAYADVKCQDAGSCDVTVNGTSTAEVDCNGGTCDVTCNSDSCLIDCTGSSSCKISTCTAAGGVTTCSNGDYKVCGVPCP